MNGNTPYAGNAGVSPPGRRSEVDITELTPDQKQAFRTSVAAIAARTREFLPNEYVVGSEISQGLNGPQATVAVHPPIGHAVSAGFEPDEDDLDSDELITDEDCGEVARGLAASAALQVKQAVESQITPTAR